MRISYCLATESQRMNNGKIMFLVDLIKTTAEQYTESEQNITSTIFIFQKIIERRKCKISGHNRIIIHASTKFTV